MPEEEKESFLDYLSKLLDPRKVAAKKLARQVAERAAKSRRQEPATASSTEQVEAETARGQVPLDKFERMLEEELEEYDLKLGE